MIHLDYRDSRPIYQQVKDNLRRMMVTGVLLPGDKLPSVRALAGQLSINPNTIQRAYAELEAEGYVVSVTGKGNFVAEGDTQNQARRQELLAKMRPMMEELKTLGMTAEEFAALWEGGKDDAASK
ncbi:MAG: GntR family transcriptional regulator [Oscillospiraceae bacterium]|nr:GntR family transcriptional regulator [Oscillospiraceae bacterium]